MDEIIRLIADVGGSLGLALFAIWMLRKAYEQQEDRAAAVREELQAALERNTKAWETASTTLARMSTIMLFVARHECGEGVDEDGG